MVGLLEVKVPVRTYQLLRTVRPSQLADALLVGLARVRKLVTVHLCHGVWLNFLAKRQH